MKKLIELLQQAEAEAKRLADAQNHLGAPQMLRAKVRHALEFAESPLFAEKPERPEPK